MNVFVFPGQGAQFVGMGADLAEKYPEVRELYDRANELLGFDITNICLQNKGEYIIICNNVMINILFILIYCG